MPTTVVEPPLWPALCHALRLDHRTRRKVWRALSTSEDPVITALVYNFWAADWEKPSDITDIARLMNTACTPARLMDALELLVRDGRLTRRDVASVEEAILTRTAANGDWL